MFLSTDYIEGMEFTRRLELRIDRQTQERLDQLRGEQSRSEWIRDRINHARRTEIAERLAERLET